LAYLIISLNEKFDELTLITYEGFSIIPNILVSLVQNNLPWKNKLKNFIDFYKADLPNIEGLDAELDQILSAELEKRINENRERLSGPIIKCIVYCGKTNQALGGHRDDSTQDSKHRGNFKDLIEFRIESGDVKLKEHLETDQKNLTYLSKTTQNQSSATFMFICDTIFTNGR
jgi:hypothetical protein